MTRSFLFFFLSFYFLVPSSVYADFDETQIQKPINESNEEILFSSSCRTREHGFWDVCYSVNPQNEKLMRSFKFSNSGVNETVPNSGFMIGRDFEFNFEGLARSDMSLLVWDSPDQNESHGHLKIMYFFPRDILPAIRFDDSQGVNYLIVTLPTREEVIFDEKSHQVVAGVLNEAPIKQTSGGPATAPAVQYQGTGVVVEATALADWPVGFEGEKAAKTVLIKKKGHKFCVVPGKELFYTDHKKGGNVFFNKKYLTDKAFDSYVQNRCGFSIY